MVAGSSCWIGEPRDNGFDVDSTPRGAALHEPIAAPADPALVAAELAALPLSRVLSSARGLEVRMVRWAEAPSVMHELGRLREQTFRAAGEGTGRALDLDRFDRWYDHLVLWDAQGQRVQGAYRLGHVGRVLAKRGLDGLYTATLVHYDSAFFCEHPGALELGRSFLCPEAQRSLVGLALLWEAIGRYVCDTDDLRYLFGPVSVDQGYCAEALDLIVGYLRAHRWVDDAEALLHPRTPYRPHSELHVARGGALSDEWALEAAVKRAQPDDRGVPVLLRQYLRLNASVAAFNIDPDFSDVLDALIVVDLQAVEHKRLVRFMGAQQAARFLARDVA